MITNLKPNVNPHILYFLSKAQMCSPDKLHFVKKISCVSPEMSRI